MVSWYWLILAAALGLALGLVIGRALTLASNDLPARGRLYEKRE
jgi:hypothetical protein